MTIQNTPALIYKIESIVPQGDAKSNSKNDFTLGFSMLNVHTLTDATYVSYGDKLCMRARKAAIEVANRALAARAQKNEEASEAGSPPPEKPLSILDILLATSGSSPDPSSK